MSLENEAKSNFTNKVLLEILKSLEQGEINEAKIARKTRVSANKLYKLLNHTIPHLEKKIKALKESGQFNRQEFSKEKHIEVEVIKLIEKRLRELKLGYVMPEINHLQGLVNRYCGSSQKGCDSQEAEQHFKSDIFKSSESRWFKHTVISEEQGKRGNKKKRESDDREVTDYTVEVFFRQIKYCLWIGKEHCESTTASDYFLTQRFERFPQFESLVKKMRSTGSEALGPIAVTKLTNVMQCLVKADYTDVVDAVMQPTCPIRSVISVLINNPKRDRTQDMNILTTCLEGVDRNSTEFYEKMLPKCIGEI